MLGAIPKIQPSDSFSKSVEKLMKKQLDRQLEIRGIPKKGVRIPPGQMEPTPKAKRSAFWANRLVVGLYNKQKRKQDAAVSAVPILKKKIAQSEDKIRRLGFRTLKGVSTQKQLARENARLKVLRSVLADAQASVVAPTLTKGEVEVAMEPAIREMSKNITASTRAGARDVKRAMRSEGVTYPEAKRMITDFRVWPSLDWTGLTPPKGVSAKLPTRAAPAARLATAGVKEAMRLVRRGASKKDIRNCLWVMGIRKPRNKRYPQSTGEEVYMQLTQTLKRESGVSLGADVDTGAQAFGKFDVAEGAEAFGRDVDTGAQAFGKFDVSEGAEAFGSDVDTGAQAFGSDVKTGAQAFYLSGAGAEDHPYVNW